MISNEFFRTLCRITIVLTCIHLGSVCGATLHGVTTINNSTNGTPHSSTGQHSVAPPWETCDLENEHLPYLWVLMYVYFTVFLFLGLAIICDDFFVPSLEAISEKLDLSEDVAGATFMAAGSSAPELFTSVAGVGVQSDVGIGTIVGSAMFNILIIVAMSAILAGKTLYLDWRPLARDTFVYGLSLVLFIGFSWDGKLEWYEATILLVIYIAYILLMKVSYSIFQLLDELTCKCCRHGDVEPAMPNSLSNQTVENVVQVESISSDLGGVKSVPSNSSSHHERHRFIHSHKGDLAGSISNRRKSTSLIYEHGHFQHHLHTLSHEPGEPTVPEEESHKADESEEAPGDLEEDEPAIKLLPCLPAIVAAPPSPDLFSTKCGLLKYIVKWHLFIQSFPFLVAFTWTIPNCNKYRRTPIVIAAFCISVFWIALLSFAMVTVVAKIGCLLNINEYVMGLVVVAVGTSIPDALSSILVARDGYGDMAISNAIGSNVFDVNLGLGLPFLIRILIDRGKPFSLLSSEQQAHFNDYVILPHPKFCILLLLVLLIMLGLLTVIRCRLNKITGLCLVVMYLLFLAYSFIQELVCQQGIYC